MTYKKEPRPETQQWLLVAIAALAALAIVSIIMEFPAAITTTSMVACIVLLLVSFFFTRTMIAHRTHVLKLGNTNREAIGEVVNDFLQREKEAEQCIVSLSNNEALQQFRFLKADTGVGFQLFTLQQKLDHYRQEETKRSWVQGGLAKFGGLVKEGDSLEEFSNHIISQLVRYMEINQAAMFVIEEEMQETFLELKACYAYDRKKFVNKRITAGQGLVGECMISKSPVYMTDVPQDYVTITSGLGEALPRAICIFPLVFDNTLVGVLEIASFNKLEKYKLEFLETVCKTIAGEISSRKTVQGTAALLEQSQNLMHELQAQEEEMRQNMEELTATQEEMARKQSELTNVMAAINNTVVSIEFAPDGKILSANKNFISISNFNENDLQSLSYYDLLPVKERSKPQHAMVWENVRAGKFFEGEYVFRHRAGHDLFLSGTINPMLNNRGVVYKVIMIANFITQEKIKQQELNGMVQALRNSVPLVELDKNLTCLSANDLFLKMFDIKRLQLKNRAFCSFLHASSIEPFKKSTFHTGDRSFFEAELKFQTHDRTSAYRVTFSCIRDLDGNVSRVLVVLTDYVRQSEAISQTA